MSPANPVTMDQGQNSTPVRASLRIERAERVRLGRAATMRERKMVACDVVIEDLSATGCRVRGGMMLPVGSLISIGIPGTGMHAARVARVGDGEFGCAFLIPVGEEDIARACSIDTVAEGNFPTMLEKIRMTEEARFNRRATDDPNLSLVDRLKAALALLLRRG